MSNNNLNQPSLSYQANSVFSLLRQVAQCLHDTKKELSTSGAAFSPFSENLIYMGETGISRILGMLFSPESTHYQGSYFLDQFLKILPDFATSVPVDATCVNVVLERSTWEIGSNRRIDIVVEGPDFVLGIENKIWAQDQEMQLADYLRWLKRVSNGRKFFLVYLTPYGHRADNYTLPEAAQKEYQGCYASLAWVDLAEALTERARELPERVSVFVQDFCASILEKIGETNALRVDMDSKVIDMLASYIKDDEFLAAQNIYKNYIAATNLVINEWECRLVEELKNMGVKGKITRHPYPNRNQWNETIILGIDYDEQKLGAGIYTANYYNEVLSWGIYAQTWEFSNDAARCMAHPPVKHIMNKYNVDALQENNVIRHTCDNLRIDDPRLLVRLRRKTPIYLATEMYELCKIIEELA